jgi:GT2 family glycosyltransferase
MPRVTAAVLNYNGRELLEVILPSLAAQTFTDLETIVVDNASTDDSAAYLAARWPDVRVISTGPANVGVAAALNVAVRGAQGEYVALLNNDIELAPAWLAELVGALDRHPDAGSVACKLLSYWERDVLDGAGNVFTPSATGWQRGQGQRDVGQFGREEEVFAPTAGAALYRAAALADVGPFDESFFAYIEDVDWGLRAQIAGRRCWYAPAAVAYHMGSRSTGGNTNPFYYELAQRNTMGLLIKDVPGRFIARHAHRILAHHAMALVYGARGGMLRPHLRALRSLRRMAPGWRAERRRIFAAARIDLRDFERFVTER